MVEVSRFWNGTTTGDATEAPYDADTEFAEVLAAIAGTGVVFGRDNELSASSGVATVVLATGQAFVDGTWYKNRNALTFSTVTTGNIILRKDWPSQTVRAYFVAGALSLANSPGAQIETALWGVAVDGGGAITLTDLRSSALPRLGGITPSSIEYSDPAIVGASGVAADSSHQHAMAHGPVGAYKAADTARSSATASADPDLAVPVAINGRYTFNAYLVYRESIDTMNFKFGFAGPAGSFGVPNWMLCGVDDAGVARVEGPYELDQITMLASHTADRAVMIQGTFINGGIAGNFAVEWAANAANGGTISLLTGSGLSLLRVG